MGLDTTRVQGEVDEELICPICSAVLDDPIQAPVCEHAFCRACIHEWLARQQVCPIDRQAITVGQLKPVPRILRNMLSRLVVLCENEQFGCAAAVPLDQLEAHLKQCQHNPKRPVTCEHGCGLVVPLDELTNHNCVHSLRDVVGQQSAVIGRLQQEMADTRYQLAELTRELHLVKDFVQAVRGGDSGVEQYEVLQWSVTLPRARIVRWGGMVSTPDALLKVMIQRCLSESGAPSHVLEHLMEHSHERRWPPGLSTLETRQANRRHYDQYVCRRVPGKQAVVVMACENRHMQADMMLEPGLVLIFAHGVETETSTTLPMTTVVNAGANLSGVAPTTVQQQQQQSTMVEQTPI